MSFNDRGLYGKDVRRVYSGKDTAIFDEDGKQLSTVETFQIQVNFTNANYQALGSPIQQEHITGYSVTGTMTNCIIEDDRFIRDIFDFFHVGRHAPMWNIRSVIYGYGDGDNESVYIFRDCVPSGQVDLHNFTVGDVIKRAINFHCNQPPDLQKLLTCPD